jgi:RNA:NAD 2'-phosphotransferase (TPT1/KptA family)
VIVFHGTTIEHRESIERDGLMPNTYVARSRDLSVEYARTRGMSRGSDGVVIFEFDVPDAAVVEVQSWWWAQDQLLLPFGCPPSGIVSVEVEDFREDVHAAAD